MLLRLHPSSLVSGTELALMPSSNDSTSWSFIEERLNPAELVCFTSPLPSLLREEKAVDLSTCGRHQRHDTVVVQHVAGMLAVRDGVVDQSLLVFDPGRLGKVYHCIGVVLLRTCAHAHKESVDA